MESVARAWRHKLKCYYGLLEMGVRVQVCGRHALAPAPPRTSSQLATLSHILFILVYFTYYDLPRYAGFTFLARCRVSGGCRIER